MTEGDLFPGSETDTGSVYHLLPIGSVILITISYALPAHLDRAINSEVVGVRFEASVTTHILLISATGIFSLLYPSDYLQMM